MHHSFSLQSISVRRLIHFAAWSYYTLSHLLWHIKSTSREYKHMVMRHTRTFSHSVTGLFLTFTNLQPIREKKYCAGYSAAMLAFPLLEDFVHQSDETRYSNCYETSWQWTDMGHTTQTIYHWQMGHHRTLAFLHNTIGHSIFFRSVDATLDHVHSHSPTIQHFR